MAPEIAALLHHVADWTQHALINTLWNTGGRISEVVPLLGGADPAYVDEMRRLFASTKEAFETDGVTGERRALPVWTVSDRTVRNWLTRAVDDAARGGIRLSTDVSPHTFRHSFAMHMLYNHVPPEGAAVAARS